MSYAILYDSTRCLECEGCVNACRVKNELPDDEPDQLSEYRFLELQKVGGEPIRRACMHCEEPACASVCPVGALSKSPEGPVVYDPDKCMGCRYCMVACPFNVPKYEWSKAVPRVRKCVMCYDRVKEGKKPACTMFCPADAIRFGDRDELLAEAKARMSREPDRYYPHVYGEKEAGGTGVLVIAAVAPEKLGLPVNLPTEALPQRTWNVLSRLPGVVAVGAAFCMGMWWLVNRRDKVRADQALAARRKALAEATEVEEEVTA